MGMKVSYNWLRELVPLEWSPAQLADGLTMAGLEVDNVYRLAGDMPGIVTGMITALEKHPGADNLYLARLDVAGAAPAPLQVVTGAPNIKVGSRVPLALPGAVLPGGRVIREAEFKGVVSQGMMCSAEELGLELSPADEGGIMILPPDTPVGKGITEVLGLDDYVLELDLTPNRGDCLSMVGVAREVAALTGVRPCLPEIPEGDGGLSTPGEEEIRVTVADPHLCPRYTMRLLTDIRIGPSPLWMQQRLRAAGMRPINNMVDVTNYVMLELGQPLHAFDRDLIRGGEIIVRRAFPGEKIITLDDQERTLTGEMLVIADPVGAVGIAGVMGGANSEITPGTRRVLLESACFNNISIRKTARALGLRSEASNRFEKGVDPRGTLRAANRAAFLMEEMGAGRMLPLVVDVCPREITPVKIDIRPERVGKLLGAAIPAEEIKDILTRLEFKVEGTASFLVTVPTFRPDVEQECDLVEEVARIYGYNRIEGKMLQGTLTPAQRFSRQKLEDQIKDLLAGWGLTEIVTYSFYSPRYYDYLRLPEDHPLRRCIPLQNPISEMQSVMRTTLLPNMIETLATNLKRKNTDLAFFEIGRTYRTQLPIRELPQEPRFLALGLAGRARESNWNRPEEPVDFFTLKGLLEALGQELGLGPLTFVPGEHPSFHPGRQAEIWVDEEQLGLMGELHPDVGAAWDIEERLYLAELDLEALAGKVKGELRYRQLPRFPFVVRDLAILVEERVTAAQVEEVIAAAGGELLVEVKLFDQYQGKQIPAGKRSLAYSLVYRAPDWTLTDEEVTEIHTRIVRALAGNLGAALRQ
jgi:phenylalanyl-tRNA synthetase beta chain